MERRALIIGSPDDKIKGVYDDMKNYRAFMESSAGGGWFSTEITTLESPDRATLQLQLEKLKKVNYSIVVFAGHGEYSVVDRQTILQLRPGVKISEHELKQGAPMRTVILDACRVFTQTSLREQVVKSSMAMDSAPNVRSSRVIFDEHLRKCHAGLAVMYGCDLDEGAGDIPGEGGRYSSALLRTSGNWNLRSPDGHSLVLTVSDAHDTATETVKRTSGGTQNPKGEFPRTLPRFPFAITP
jgi:hypothetical protein